MGFQGQWAFGRRRCGGLKETDEGFQEMMRRIHTAGECACVPAALVLSSTEQFLALAPDSILRYPEIVLGALISVTLSGLPDSPSCRKGLEEELPGIGSGKSCSSCLQCPIRISPQASL